jgi:hypothetical protein
LAEQRALAAVRRAWLVSALAWAAEPEPVAAQVRVAEQRVLAAARGTPARV